MMDTGMESSEDKTKRKFAAYLRSPIWTFQYSVFYDAPEESCNLLKDQKVFRQELGRKFPNQPFLIRIQTLDRGVHQAYLTIYTTQKTPGIMELADRYFPTMMNVVYRSLTEHWRMHKARTILKQRPQDLTKLFGEVRLRRYGVINKSLLEDIDTEVY
jgi:hypothetical protein